MRVKGKQKRTLTKLEIRIRKKRLKQWSMALSAIVVFCVTYALILPAITISSTTYCKKEEHTHSAECYLSKTPLCGLEEEEAIEGHSHDDSCYETNEEGEKVLICTKAETVSTAGHTHTESCYSSADLICGLEEHTHIRQCYSNTEAVEDESCWIASVPEKLDEDVNKAILEVAKSQKGYKESEDNFEVQDDGSEKGYTRYGNWADDSYGDWNNYFTGFVLNYAGVNLDDLFYNKVISTWNSNTQTIQKTNLEDLSEGNIVFYIDEKSNALSTGIVNEIDEKNEKIEIYTGDQEDKVDLIKIKNESIIGYLQAKENEKSSKESQAETPEQEEQTEAEDKEDSLQSREPSENEDINSDAKQNNEENTLQSFIYKNQRLQITVSYDDLAEIPDGSVLQVESESEEKDTFHADISIVYEGKEIEPKGPVTVSIKFFDGSFKDEDTLSFKHYLDGENVYETLTSQKSQDEEGNPIFTFTSYSFSDYEGVSSEQSDGNKDSIKNTTIYLSYLFEDGTMACETQILNFGADGFAGYSHKLPIISGYVAYGPYYLKSDGSITDIDGKTVDLDDVDGDDSIATFVIPEKSTNGSSYVFFYKPALVKYKILYFQQCSQSNCIHSENTETRKLYEKNYHLAAEVVKTGLTGSTPEIDSKNYEGYEQYEILRKDPIAADESTSVEVYYNLKSYTFVVDNDGAIPATETVIRYYGDTFTAHDVSKAGYEFTGWYILDENNKKVDITEDLIVGKTLFSGQIIYASFKPITTTYDIQVWLKDSLGNYGYWLTFSGKDDAVFTKTTGKSVTYSEIKTHVKELLLTQDLEWDYYEIDRVENYEVDSSDNLINNDANAPNNPNDTILINSVNGDGSSTISIYVKPKTYTLRFYYARSSTSNSSTCQIPTLNSGWSSANSSNAGTPGSDTELALLNSGVNWTTISGLTASDIEGLFTGSSDQLALSSVTYGSYRYYYIELTADYSSSMYDLWPCNKLSDVGDYKFMTWGSKGESGYRKTSGGKVNSNVVGVYAQMDSVMADTPSRTSDIGPVQSFVAYFKSKNLRIFEVTYYIYYSALPSELEDDSIEKISYTDENGNTNQYVLHYEPIVSNAGSPLQGPGENRFVAPNFVGVGDNAGYEISKIYSANKNSSTNEYDESTAITTEGNGSYVSGVSGYGNQTYYQSVNIYYVRENRTITLFNKEGSTITIDIPFGESLDKYKVSQYSESIKEADSTKTQTVILSQSIPLSEMSPLSMSESLEKQFEWTGNWSKTKPDTPDYSNYDEDEQFDFDSIITTNICLIPEYTERTVQINFYKNEGADKEDLITSERIRIYYSMGETYGEDYSPIQSTNPLANQLLGWYIKVENGNGEIVNQEIDLQTYHFTEDTNVYASIDPSNKVSFRVEFYKDSYDSTPFFSYIDEDVELQTRTIDAVGSGQFEQLAKEKGIQFTDPGLTNYYPDRVSTSVTFNEDKSNELYDAENNIYVIKFLYTFVEENEYTVIYNAYLENDSDGSLTFVKNLETNTVKTKEIVHTETYKVFPGYVSADSVFQQTLVLSSDPSQNIITFKYVAGKEADIYLEFYVENIDGSYEQYGSTITYNEAINTYINPASISISGYKLSKTDVYENIVDESESNVEIDQENRESNKVLETENLGYLVPKNGLTFKYYYDGLALTIEKTWLDTEGENISFIITEQLNSQTITSYQVDMDASSSLCTVQKNLDEGSIVWKQTYYLPYLSSENDKYVITEQASGYIPNFIISNSFADAHNSASAILSISTDVDEYTVQLTNKKGKALPSTGGIGTDVLTYTGALISGSALVMYEYDQRKKRERRKNNSS